ncbi:MAG: hypothetical protein ACQETI_07160 [Halobacteriota archaeon]
MEREWAWWAIALLAVATLAGAVAVTDSGPSAPVSDRPELLELRDGSRLWPHTSRARSFDQRTLAINVLVYADPADARRALTRRGPTDWEPTGNETVADTDVVVPWTEAHGSKRYTYVERGDGHWLGEHYQLDAGDYLGTRTHVRAYAVEGGNWTAMQAHSEYWDWFRLRHTVDDVDAARGGVTSDLRRGAGATVVETDRDAPPKTVIVIAGVTLAVAARRRADWSTVTPALATGGTYLAVRALGIGAERGLSWLPPKAIASVGYLVLVLGIPALAYAAGGRDHVNPWQTFALASGGLGVALAVDAAAMGATAVSTSVALHRVSVVLAVGLFAAAGTDQGPSRALGATVWTLALAAPLAALV